MGWDLVHLWHVTLCKLMQSKSAIIYKKKIENPVVFSWLILSLKTFLHKLNELKPLSHIIQTPIMD